MEYSSEVITLEIDEHVATIWLDRPEARNALGRAFWRDLPRAARVIEEDSRVRVVVVAAKGRDFTVGLDLKEMGGALGGEAASAASRAASAKVTFQAVRDMQDAVTSLAKLRVPVIAAVHGYCIGGGIDVISACDIRLGTTNSLYSVRETKVAIVADLGTLQRLPRIISAGYVAELAYTGKDVSAGRAAQIGLLNHAVGEDASEVLDAAYELAREIAANSPLAVEGTKAVLAANDGATIDEGLEFVARWNTMYLQSNDLREAMSAFLERRAPKFTGD
ncbi:MAG TPA: crotonase/enoyl-CoA hydratase family protein [Acidimicrobiales bacterium]|nr:crotonase/enoyl-CoA hydratase family protein [Acidimicrobiales bacterium]